MLRAYIALIRIAKSVMIVLYVEFHCILHYNQPYYEGSTITWLIVDRHRWRIAREPLAIERPELLLLVPDVRILGQLLHFAPPEVLLGKAIINAPG